MKVAASPRLHVSLSPSLPVPASPLPLSPVSLSRHVEARMRSPLRIRASTVATHFTKAPSVTKPDRNAALLVTSLFVANLVGIYCGSRTTGDRADNCALLAAD